MLKKQRELLPMYRKQNIFDFQGMACVGRTKVCSIVPPNHFGPIPGVPVGSAWKFRVQVCLFFFEFHRVI